MAKVKHLSDGTNTWDVGGGTEVFDEVNPTAYESLKTLSPITVFNDGNDDRLALIMSGFAGSLDLSGNTLSLMTNGGNVMNSVNLSGGPKKVVAYWDSSTATTMGTNCAKYTRLGMYPEEDLNIGDIVIANPATSYDCCYTDLVALNTDDTGNSRFFIDIHGLQTSPLEPDGSYYSDINHISADRQWVFVVADTLTCLDQSSNEYTKYVLIPYSMIPILDNDNVNYSHTGRGISIYDTDIVDCTGRVLFSYGCGRIMTGAPISLVDTSGVPVFADSSYTVIGANKEFTSIFRYNSGTNQVIGVKTDTDSKCLPTSLYVTGGLGMPKSVPLYYHSSSKTYRLINGVDLASESWSWFAVTGLYNS